MGKGLNRIILAATLLSMALVFCSCKAKGKMGMDLKKETFGKPPLGREVELYTLTNAHSGLAGGA